MIKKFNNDIKSAMRSKDVLLRDILKFVLAKAKDIAIARPKGERDLLDADLLLATQRQIKQNKDVISIAKENGRDYQKDQNEIDILQAYLPTQMDEEAVSKLVSDIVNKIPEEDRNPRARGLVMKELSQYKDVLDMKFAGQLAGKFLIVDNNIS